MKTVILLEVAVFFMAAALRWYPPLGMGLAEVFLPSQCNVMEAVRSGAYNRELSAARERVLTSARMVEQDGDLQLWDVPGARQFWIYKKFDTLNAFAFAEQVADQYRHPSVHIQPGDIVLDVGADYGSVTWQALRSGARKVIAIEIAPQKCACLNRTFAREIAEDRIAVVPLGVWDHDGTLELGGDSVVLERGEQKQTVRVTTIDQIVADLRLPGVNFIAMDIEGAEKPALRGAAGTLRRFHPRMAIASEHLPDDVVAIPQTVRAIVPDYRVICGRCNVTNKRLVANVLWFH